MTACGQTGMSARRACGRRLAVPAGVSVCLPQHGIAASAAPVASAPAAATHGRAGRKRNRDGDLAARSRAGVIDLEADPAACLGALPAVRAD